MDDNIAPSVWHKSSYSNGTRSDCVEVAVLSAGYGLRDSRHPDHATLALSYTEWNALLASIKTGQF